MRTCSPPEDMTLPPYPWENSGPGSYLVPGNLGRRVFGWSLGSGWNSGWSHNVGKGKWMSGKSNRVCYTAMWMQAPSHHCDSKGWNLSHPLVSAPDLSTDWINMRTSLNGVRIINTISLASETSWLRYHNGHTVWTFAHVRLGFANHLNVHTMSLLHSQHRMKLLGRSRPPTARPLQGILLPGYPATCAGPQCSLTCSHAKRKPLQLLLEGPLAEALFHWWRKPPLAEQQLLNPRVLLPPDIPVTSTWLCSRAPRLWIAAVAFMGGLWVSEGEKREEGSVCMWLQWRLCSDHIV